MKHFFKKSYLILTDSSEFWNKCWSSLLFTSIYLLSGSVRICTPSYQDLSRQNDCASAVVGVERSTHLISYENLPIKSQGLPFFMKLMPAKFSTENRPGTWLTGFQFTGNEEAHFLTGQGPWLHLGTLRKEKQMRKVSWV